MESASLVLVGPRVHIVPIRERAAGVTGLVKLNVAYLPILW